MPRSVAVFVVLSALLATPIGSASGQTPTTAVIRGAERVYMRRGPGTSHPAFRTIPRGVEVTVEAVEGSWAHIRTADGERGYVNDAFLEPRSGGAPAPHGEVSEAAPTPSGTAATPAAASPPQRDDAKVPTVEPSRTPIIASVPSATPAAGKGSDGADGDIHSDVRKLLLLTEEMHRQLSGERAAPTPAPFTGGSTDAPGVASTLALTGAGLLVGFLIGTGYGRYQERNRRTRVRF